MKKLNRLDKIAALRVKEKGGLTYDHMVLKEINRFTNEELMEIALLRMTKGDLLENLNVVSMQADKIETRLHIMNIVDDELKDVVNNIYDTINNLFNVLTR